jgi:mycofactocin glycosyltransferase
MAVRGLPVSGLPVSGLPVSGLPVSGLPVSGLPVSGLPVTVDASVRRLRDGRLVGGDPRRLVRLSPAGERSLRALIEGGSADASMRVLARRLIDAGILHPDPDRVPDQQATTIVIPARDRLLELDRCLAAATPTAGRVIVVDDGSSDPERLASVVASHGAELIRRSAPGGPAAARNLGVSACTTELVAFLDSDCVPETDWLTQLTGHFEDPLVAAVAPRVRPRDRRADAGASATTLDRYLAARSPLDMGVAAAPVDRRGRVRYLPAAALIVRRAALGSGGSGGAGGFDEALRYGEDVDLVWRLRAAGWRVRYDPAVTVRHDEPRRITAALKRRFHYGSAAAALSHRHPGAVPPAILTPEALVIAAAMLTHRPRLAAAALGSGLARSAAMGARRGVPVRLAARWAPASMAAATLEPGRAVATFGLLPAVAFAAARRDPRPLLLAATPALATWRPRPGGLDPVRFAALALADDAAYGAGVISGAIRGRSVRVLLPTIRW